MNRSHIAAVNRDQRRRYGALAASIAEGGSHDARHNPPSERTIQSTYSVYARLRRHSPVHRSVIQGSWILSRYDDVLAVTRDHERFSNDPRWRNAIASVLPSAPDDYSILLVDPLEDTQLRKIVERAFIRPRLMALAPTVAAFVEEILERAVEGAEVEWVGEVAHPIAMQVMLHVLGTAGNEETRCLQWSTGRARQLKLIANRAEQ